MNTKPLKIKDLKIGSVLLLEPNRYNDFKYREFKIYNIIKEGADIFVDVMENDKDKSKYTHQNPSQFDRIKYNKITNWKQEVEK